MFGIWGRKATVYLLTQLDLRPWGYALEKDVGQLSQPFTGVAHLPLATVHPTLPAKQLLVWRVALSSSSLGVTKKVVQWLREDAPLLQFRALEMLYMRLLANSTTHLCSRWWWHEARGLVRWLQPAGP
jgi:hypothetical protein